MKRTNASASPTILGLMLITVCGSAYAAESLGKLRSEMAKTEKQFFDLYNKLNTDPQFAILCRRDTPTGTKFAVRVCQPKYQMQAAEKSANEQLHAALTTTDRNGAAGANGLNVGAWAGGGPATVQDADDAFRKNMLAALQKSPELQALGKRRDALQARYDVTLKEGH